MITKEISIKYHPQDCKYLESFSFDVITCNGFNSVSYNGTSPLAELSHFDQLKIFLLDEITLKNVLEPTTYSFTDINQRTINRLGKDQFKVLEDMIKAQNRWENI